MPLFGKSHKSPTDIVKTLKDNLGILVKQDKKTDKVGVCIAGCGQWWLPVFMEFSCPYKLIFRNGPILSHIGYIPKT